MLHTKIMRKSTTSKQLKDLEKGLTRLGEAEVAIGYFDGEIHEDTKMTLASLMTLLEYGSNDGKIPARFPFSKIAQTDSPKRNRDVQKLVKQGLQHALQFGGTETLLDSLGKHYESSIRSIFGNTSKLISNAKMTQNIKGRDEPLIDTGELLSKLSYKKLRR